MKSKRGDLCSDCDPGDCGHRHFERILGVFSVVLEESESSLFVSSEDGFAQEKMLIDFGSSDLPADW